MSVLTREQVELITAKGLDATNFEKADKWRDELLAHDAALRTQLKHYKAAIEVIQSSRDICLNTFTAWAKDEYGPAKHALRKLPELEQRNAALVEALEFYANPETYFAIGFFPDSPNGEFMDDFEETELGMKPGKRARQALARAKED